MQRINSLLKACLFLSVLASCSAPPAAAPCDCTKIKAIDEPASCATASAPAPTTDPQLLLMEKQQQLATLQKEIAELKAMLQPKGAPAPKEESEPDKTAKVTKKTKEPAEKPVEKPVEKPAEEPKKVPALKIVPR